MRIISQNKKIDIPYDFVSIQREGRSIFAQGNVFGNGEDNFIKIANYCTEKKAQEAMDKLKDAYLEYLIYKTMQEEKRVIYQKQFSEEGKKKLYGVWQFPPDESIKIED